MNALELEFQHVEDPFALPTDLLDVHIPPASLHPQLSLPYLDFSSLESGGLPPKRQVDSSSSIDNHSAPSLITDHGSISSHPETPGARDETPCRNPEGRCVDLATRVLSSMHPGSNSCILSIIGQDGDRRPQPSRGADTVLNLNQSALAAVRSILRCSCCGVPQVLLLVTALCSQIGASYRQVVDVYSQRGGPNANSAVLSVNAGKVETRRRDFYIGNHRLSQDVEAAVIRQVLSGMLRELEVVVGNIAYHAGQSPAVNDPRSDLMLSGVRARMVAFLHTQVRALTSALNRLESDVGSGLPPNLHC
ncbi:MAG: hypothetical protein L6R37_004148 [Teloschistes peruensis]|nr:MAG: hypothetical protein L6R37_004148 [Teloschistes peruensis]